MNTNVVFNQSERGVALSQSEGQISISTSSRFPAPPKHHNPPAKITYFSPPYPFLHAFFTNRIYKFAPFYPLKTGFLSGDREVPDPHSVCDPRSVKRFLFENLVSLFSKYQLLKILNKDNLIKLAFLY